MGIDFTLMQSPENKLVAPLMYPVALSILYLAAVLERAGAKVAVVDLREKRLAEVRLEDIPPARFFGITATTPEYSSALTLARLLKARYPDSKTIIGGAHASALPNDCLQDGWDIVGTGEWEKAIVKLFKNGYPEGIVHAGRIPDLNNLPFPARRLAGERAFSNTLMPGHTWGEGERAAMIISSRGCPYRCNFCASARTLPVRLRSPENVAAEVQELVERYSVRAFRDESDNILGNRKWFLRLCELLAPLKVSWKGHSRSEHVTDELLEAARAAGMVEMGLGVESADPEVLRLMGKGETVGEHYWAVALIKKHGIISKVYFISGLPGETDKTLELNAQFMREAKPDKWTLSRFTPFPGSAVWQNPSRYGAIVHKDSFSGYWLYSEESMVEYEGVSKEVLNKRFKRMLAYLESDEWRKAW